MRSLYTLIILMCTVRCCAMEDQVSFCEKPPLKKQKGMSENDLRAFESKNLKQMAAIELSENGDIVADGEASVPEIITKIYAAIEQKEASEAIQWHARLQEKIYVDWQFLNEEQITTYVNIDCDMFEKIQTILPLEIKRLSPSEQESLYNPQAIVWVRKAVEANTDTALDWRAAFGSSEFNKPIPSPQSLRKHRLEQLGKIGTVQAQRLAL